jgi:hypothetical protein
MGERLGRCRRRPPDGWPGGRCSALARYEVRYFIAIAPQPRRIEVCHEHLMEMFKAQELGALREMEVVEVANVK